MDEKHNIPTWLRVVNNLLFGWWAFLMTALVGGGMAALLAALLQSEIQGFIFVISTVVVCLIAGIAGAVLATRWWDRLMQRKTLKANCIALAVLGALSLVLGPGPMMFIE